MEISKLVDYEQLFDLEIMNPITDKPTGITMKIRSAGSAAAKKVLREHTNKQIERNIKGKKPTSESLEQQELEKAASYIASWDWGSNTYEGEVPKLTMETAIHILDKEGWIFAPVVEAANEIGNFSSRSATTSAPK